MPSVLIVDPGHDTREILRSALESRGLSALEAARLRDGASIARRAQPDLIVLDVGEDHRQAAACRDVAREAGRQNTPVIILGTAGHSAQPPAGGAFIRKPYHYGPLLRKIEQLLADRGAA